MLFFLRQNNKKFQGYSSLLTSNKHLIQYHGNLSIKHQIILILDLLLSAGLNYFKLVQSLVYFKMAI